MYVNQKALKAVIKEHLSSSLKPKPKPKKYKYSLEQEKAQILEMIGSVVQKTLKENVTDIEKKMIERIEGIDWQEKAKETVRLMILQLRGKVE